MIDLWCGQQGIIKNAQTCFKKTCKNVLLKRFTSLTLTYKNRCFLSYFIVLAKEKLALPGKTGNEALGSNDASDAHKTAPNRLALKSSD